MDIKVITTVLTAAQSYDLTTLDVVKDELNIKTKASDGTLKRYLSWASTALAQECNRVFPVETIKDEIWPAHDHSGVVADSFEILQLSRWPLISIASLTEITSSTEAATTLVDGTDFRIDPKAGQLIRIDASGRIMKWRPFPKAATFDAGFATIPGDIADAVTRMVRNRFRAKGRDTYLISENIPGVRDSRWWIATGNEAGNMPPDVADLVENYRVPVII